MKRKTQSNQTFHVHFETDSLPSFKSHFIVNHHVYYSPKDSCSSNLIRIKIKQQHANISCRALSFPVKVFNEHNFLFRSMEHTKCYVVVFFSSYVLCVFRDCELKSPNLFFVLKLVIRVDDFTFVHFVGFFYVTLCNEGYIVLMEFYFFSLKKFC